MSWPYDDMEDGDVIKDEEDRDEAAQRILEERERVLSHAPPSILAPREKYERPVHGGYPERAADPRVVHERGRYLTPEQHAAMLDVHAGDDGA